MIRTLDLRALSAILVLVIEARRLPLLRVQAFVRNEPTYYAFC